MLHLIERVTYWDLDDLGVIDLNEDLRGKFLNMKDLGV